jgi:manganese-dependent inorganic pyrophosphatase
VARELADVAGVDPEELGQAILARASDVSERSAEELLLADFKDFSLQGCSFGIGTIETTHAAPVLARADELLAAMARVRRRGYTGVLFAVIDIIREQSTILIDGPAPAVAAAFDTPLLGEQSIAVPRILSRKKDIVPLLGTICTGA